MNWYAARQRKDQRWDYTCQNSSGVFPMGYCAGWRETTTEDIAARPELAAVADHILADQEKRRPHRAKYHTDGHASEEEACACWKRYQLDNELRLHDPPKDPDTLHRCAADCGIFTAGLAEVGEHWHRHLCDEHRTREVVERLFLATRSP